MRVQFTVGIAAAAWSYYPTQVVEVGGEEYTMTHIPEDIAERWLDSGHVVPVEASPDTVDPVSVETAMRGPDETATRPRRTRPRPR